jgi:hypothetical protein
MTDITTRLRTAIGEEPPMSFEAADVITAGRKARRRRRAACSAAVAAGAATAVGATLVALPGSTVPAGITPAPKLTLDALVHNAATAGHGQSSGSPTTSLRIGRLTFTQIVELVNTDIAADRKEPATSFGAVASTGPARELGVSVGLAPDSTPLNIQVTLPGTMSTQAATCSAPITAASGTEYQGPCSATRLADGSTLVVRSGKARGGDAIALAALILPNGRLRR